MTDRILYVGSLRPGGNGRDRVALFEAAGCTVIPADRLPFMNRGSRIERSLAARFHIGRGPAGFDQMLRARAGQGGYDVVFVDKGVWVRPATLRALKAGATTGLAIHYTPDAQFLENRSRHFFAALPLYDLAVTTKPFEVDLYRAAGAREVRLIHQGHGARLIPTPRDAVPPHLQSQVCFIGHCQPAYAALLKPLAARVPLAIWGPGWTRYAQSHPWARDVVRGDGLYGPDYALALSGTHIAIGLLSKRIPETTTTRSFEIPACGTLLLAERTADHRALFAEDREAVFFDGAEELCAKAEHYLADEPARAAIAAAGLQRSRADGHAIDRQFATVIDWIAARSTLSLPERNTPCVD